MSNWQNTMAGPDIFTLKTNVLPRLGRIRDFDRLSGVDWSHILLHHHRVRPIRQRRPSEDSHTLPRTNPVGKDGARGGNTNHC